MFPQVARLWKENDRRVVKKQKPHKDHDVLSVCVFGSRTRVMMPRWWLALRPWCLGVECPLVGGEEEDASDWAVAEVGRARGRSVTLSPSMLPLFTRDSISSERRSADSRSTWIILRTHSQNFMTDVCS